ncbi:hypothetical protein AUJ77_02935 [Candidatus Nomurabacteria bacterium CG1_02_43_90]|uniref:Uncharacterized protein n=1 Tax=Candidatus Nomurabacteria bacterium CG1_02_43_90 TaxID=1805281 RepID=A0A1J4V3F7_9BACT|nr:MAG: hypothetical protein AUJ77_02935 [Candidatus Nomurabacteria bacterium CG1_02_43_90]
MHIAPQFMKYRIATLVILGAMIVFFATELLFMMRVGIASNDLNAGYSCGVSDTQKTTIIEVNTIAYIGNKHIANLRISPCGVIKIDAMTQRVMIEELQTAVRDIVSRKVLIVHKTKDKQIEGEIVRVSVTAEIAQNDNQYPLAVAETLRNDYGFEVAVLPHDSDFF